MKKHKELRDDGRVDSKRCAWCRSPLIFPYSDHGSTDYIRAKCTTCQSQIFVFGKTQYKPLTLKQAYNRHNKEAM